MIFSSMVTLYMVPNLKGHPLSIRSSHQSDLVHGYHFEISLIGTLGETNIDVEFHGFPMKNHLQLVGFPHLCWFASG